MARFLLSLLVLAGALEAQLISGGGGSGGSSTPPAAATCAGPGTSCVVDVSSMGISSLTKVIYACKSATGADVPVTSTSTAGSPNLTSVTLNWTGNLSAITCTVQAGGSPGANGSNGLSTAAYAVTFTNETTKTVSAATLTAAGITLPTHVSPSGIVDYSDDGSHNITLTAGIPITATVYIEGGGAYVDADATLAANSDSRVASQKATKGYVDTHQVTISVKDKGAVGDGSTDDTAAIQAAITAGLAGATVVFPTSSSCYKSGALTISGASHLRLLGAGGSICWTGTGTGAPDGYIGIGLAGTNSDVTVEGMTLTGDGVAANFHAGVFVKQSAVLSGIRYLRNTIGSVTLGLEFGNSTASTVTDGLAEGNVLSNLVGTASGSGYGIAGGCGGATQYCAVTIRDNYIYRAHRHSIYISNGHGQKVIDNRVFQHRFGDATIASPTPAIMIARSQDVEISGNKVVNSYDTCIWIFPDVSANQDASRIMVSKNQCLNPVQADPMIIVGNTSAATVQAAQDVTLDGNIVSSGSTNGGTDLDLAGYRIESGLKVLLVNNRCTITNTAASSHGCLEIDGSGETAGTFTYTDLLQVKNNFFTVSGSVGSAVRFLSAASTSGIHATFRGNTFSSPANNFVFAATQTNPNISVSDQSTSGLIINAGYFLPNSTVATVAGDLACAHAADTTIAPLTITGITNAAPPVATVSTNPTTTGAYYIGTPVTVTGVTNTAFNKTYTVAGVTTTTLTLNGSAPGGGDSSGGTVSMTCGNAVTDAINGSVYSFTGQPTILANSFLANTLYTVTGGYSLFSSSAAPTIASWNLYYGSTRLYVNNAAMAIGNSDAGLLGLFGWQAMGITSSIISTAPVINTFPTTTTPGGTLANATKQPLTLTTTSDQFAIVKVGYTATGVASGTYTSGITTTGTVGQTCTLGSFNNSSTATGTVALTGTNTIAGGTALVVTNTGQSASAAPTTATATNGTATCSGTATIATVLGGAQGNAILQTYLAVRTN